MSNDYRSPTDEELCAAVDRGIADGSLILVDEALLARLRADLDSEAGTLRFVDDEEYAETLDGRFYACYSRSRGCWSVHDARCQFAAPGWGRVPSLEAAQEYVSSWHAQTIRS